LAQKREYTKRTRAQRRDYNKAYHTANAEKLKIIAKARRARDFEKIKERNRRYVAAHPEKQREWTRRWNAKNKAKLIANDKRRYDLEKCSPEQKRLVEKFYESVKLRKFVQCYYCGEKVRGADAHIDHVIALSRKGNHAVENLAASCANCNHSKGAKLPHEWPKHPQMFLTI
jgi:5-methylcytosine-specific restriction endonuclease McrA